MTEMFIFVPQNINLHKVHGRRLYLPKNIAGAHKGPSTKYKRNLRTLKSKLRA